MPIPGTASLGDNQIDLAVLGNKVWVTFDLRGCPGPRGTSATGPWLSSHFLIVLGWCDGYLGDFGLDRPAQSG